MKLTNKKLVLNVTSDFNSKDEVFELLAKTFFENDIATNEKKLIKAFKKREKQGSTGMEMGIAIPHAQSDVIKEPKIAVLKLTKAIDWQSFDGKPIDLVISIVVPAEAGDKHLQILSKLATKLADTKIVKKLKTMSLIEIENFINNLEKEKSSSKPINKKQEGKNIKYIVGVTACATGIAHTFMAADKIKQAAEKLGYSYKIETQGSDGLKNELSLSDLKNADAILISSQIRLEKSERFEEDFAGKIFREDLQKVIKDPELAIKNAIEQTKKFNSGVDVSKLVTGPSTAIEEKTKIKIKDFESFKKVAGKWWTVGMGHVMTGISHMLPILVIAGLLMAVANFGGLAWTIDDKVHIGNKDWVFGLGDYVGQGPQNGWVQLCYQMNQVGSATMQFMYPIFAMYMAYSIAGKLALIPGFVGGLLAQGLHLNWVASEVYEKGGILGWAYPNGFIASSFFGAVFIASLVGYLVNILNKKIQFKQEYTTLKTMLIIPLVMSLFVFFAMEFVVNPAFGGLNYAMQQGFQKAGAAGKHTYGSAIAFGTAFDLGGPFNKAAGAIANGLNGDALNAIAGGLNPGDPGYIDPNTFNLTARTIAIIVPPIGLGLGALIGNKITKRELFDKVEIETARQTSFLGFIAISEGAIPWMLKAPMVIIPLNCLGAIIGANVAMGMGAVQALPLPAIWGWFLCGSSYGSIHVSTSMGQQIGGYIFGVLVAVIIIASGLIAHRVYLDTKKNKVKAKKVT